MLLLILHLIVKKSTNKVRTQTNKNATSHMGVGYYYYKLRIHGIGINQVSGGPSQTECSRAKNELVH